MQGAVETALYFCTDKTLAKQLWPDNSAQTKLDRDMDLSYALEVSCLETARVNEYKFDLWSHW